jgi:hypothetical protein
LWCMAMDDDDDDDDGIHGIIHGWPSCEWFCLPLSAMCVCMCPRTHT